MWVSVKLVTSIYLLFLPVFKAVCLFIFFPLMLRFVNMKALYINIFINIYKSESYQPQYLPQAFYVQIYVELKCGFYSTKSRVSQEFRATNDITSLSDHQPLSILVEHLKEKNKKWVKFAFSQKKRFTNACPVWESGAGSFKESFQKDVHQKFALPGVLWPLAPSRSNHSLSQRIECPVHGGWYPHVVTERWWLGFSHWGADSPPPLSGYGTWQDFSWLQPMAAMVTILLKTLVKTCVWKFPLLTASLWGTCWLVTEETKTSLCAYHRDHMGVVPQSVLHEPIVPLQETGISSDTNTTLAWGLRWLWHFNF